MPTSGGPDLRPWIKIRQGVRERFGTIRLRASPRRCWRQVPHDHVSESDLADDFQQERDRSSASGSFAESSCGSPKATAVAARPMRLVEDPGSERLFVNDIRLGVYLHGQRRTGKRCERYLDIDDPRWDVIPVESSGRVDANTVQPAVQESCATNRLYATNLTGVTHG